MCLKASPWILIFAAYSVLTAGEKKPAQGHVEDDSVAITATVLPAEQVRQSFGNEIANDYTALDVTIEPKGGKPYSVRFNDFILRSESSLNHSGPMSAGEIAGSGEVVVKRSYGNRQNVDSASDCGHKTGSKGQCQRKFRSCLLFFPDRFLLRVA